MDKNLRPTRPRRATTVATGVDVHCRHQCRRPRVGAVALQVKLTDEFRKIQHRQKQKEFIHEHFEQYYNGIKIDGAGYNFHYKNGKMYFAHGHYVDASDVNPKPSITGHEAMKHFAKYKNIPEKAIYNYIAELIIKEILEKTDTLPALVYRVYLYADYPQNTEVGFIDAHTGSL